MKMLTEIRVPPELAPVWEKHAQRALKALRRYTDECRTIDEKLGALGVMASLLLTYGDSLQAVELSKTSTATKN
jgi:hypothetical protein